jgi:lipopolysaccharide biosynthesis protein
MLRPIALYLPQFHPIPENDEWWGKGFTEWTNVAKCRPVFRGHYQPHLPADLGFYDLRVPEVREQQALMAKESGIFGFCYYHYWFNGKRLLNRPIDEVLKSGKPDFPFCFCWANENWSRRWDGSENDILMKQHYNFEDDKEHINFLFQYFRDPRYIKVEGKPLFIIYKPEFLPDIKKTITIWREEAHKAGFEDLYICYFENGVRDSDPHLLNFDSSIEFQPCWHKLPVRKATIMRRILNKIQHKHYTKILDYNKVSEIMLMSSLNVGYKRYPCVMPMWDNTARKKSGRLVLNDSSPEKYGKWLSEIVRGFKPFSEEENFIFINAWNEWGEGNHLEPCQKWGSAYLEVTKDVLGNKKTESPNHL